MIQDDSRLVFTKHKEPVLSCALSYNGDLAISGGQDDIAYVWNVTSGDVLFQCTGHKDSVACVAFSQRDTFVATGDMSGFIQVWRKEDGVKVFEYEIDDLNWIQWHPAVNNVLLAGTAKGDAWMWKVIDDYTCKTFQSYGSANSSGKCLPDGKRVVMGYEDGSIRIWDLKGASVQYAITGNKSLPLIINQIILISNRI